MSKTVHAISVLALLTISLCMAGCESSQKPPEVLELTMGRSPAIYSALLMVAEAKGYYQAEGVTIHWKHCSPGKICLKNLIDDQVQVATVTDLAFMKQALDHPDLRAIASIASSDSHDLLLRKDRNIKTPADLKGKRIGVTAGTSGEFYLDTYLARLDIDPTDLEIVYLPAKELPAKIADGSLDAICAWAQIVLNARNLLGDNVEARTVQNHLDFHWVLAVKPQVLSTHQEAINRLLQALLKAQSFCMAYPDEAQKIVASMGDYPEHFMEQYWERGRLNVKLDQSLVMSMENSAQWALSKQPARGKDVNVLNFLATGPLDALAPQAVTIFR